MKKAELFHQVSEVCNFIDEKLVEEVYYALIRVLSRELREKKEADLPDWGTFYLHRHAARLSLDINKGSFHSLEAKTTIKFKPNYRLKRYFHQLDA